MEKLRKTFIEAEIMTAITKMIDNPKKNGVYLDHECTAEIVKISERYWNAELCNVHDALRSRDGKIKKLREVLEDSEETLKYVLQYVECMGLSAESDIKYSLNLTKKALKDIR